MRVNLFLSIEQKGRGISLEKRRRLLRGYDRVAKPVEDKFEREINKLFKEQAKSIENAYRKYIRETKQDGISKEEAEKRVAELIDGFYDWENAAGEMFLALLPTYLLSGELGNSLFNSIYAAKDEKILFSVIREDYLDWLNTKGAEQITFVTDTTKKAVRQIIKTGLVEGMSTNKIANMISEVVEQTYKNRSRTIALNEIHNSFMRGNFLTAQESGFKKKRWITSRDESVRGNDPTDLANHVALDNQVRNIGEKFSNQLEYPGDTSGPSFETIGCRCVLAYE